MYDAGLFDPLDDDDQDFSDFMQEMLVMMDNVKNEVGAIEHATTFSTNSYRNRHNYHL
jgi:hypothetical protein